MIWFFTLTLVNHSLEPVYGMPWSPWYTGDQLWAYPDIHHASNLMYHLYENRGEHGEGSVTGHVLKKDIAENFSYEVIGKRIIDELEMM